MTIHTACLTRRDFLAGLAAVSLAGCRRAVTRPIRFGQLNAIDGTVPRLATSLGTFGRQGLSVEVSLEASGASVVQHMNSVANALDLGVMGLPPLCAMIGQNHVQPAVLATVSGSYQTCKLMTFAGTGVSAERPSTLRGRTIGYSLNTVAHQYLSRLLAKAGLSLADVQGFAAPQAALIDSLIHGDLDAAVLWEPNTQIAVRQYNSRVAAGANAKDRGTPILVNDPSLLFVTTHIVARQEAVKANRAAMVSFLRALLDAEASIKTNRAAAQQSIAEWAGLPTEDIGNFFASSNFKVRMETATLEQDLRGTMQWLKNGIPSAAAPDFQQFLDPSLLREIDTGRVSAE